MYRSFWHLRILLRLTEASQLAKYERKNKTLFETWTYFLRLISRSFEVIFKRKQLVNELFMTLWGLPSCSQKDFLGLERRSARMDGPFQIILMRSVSMISVILATSITHWYQSYPGDQIREQWVHLYLSLHTRTIVKHLKNIEEGKFDSGQNTNVWN